MFTEQQALDLLHKYNIPESRIRHCQCVATFAFDVADTIHSRHPSRDVNPEKVRIAGLLHDIGRSKDGDHEINSVAILKEEDLEDIAAIVMHGSMYEISVVRGKADESLLPSTLENKIVAYADARCKDAVVSLQERFDEILARRNLEPAKLASVKIARQRYFDLEKELRELLT
jgi:putative nucleotidyltransferase with HDIG domain